MSHQFTNDYCAIAHKEILKALETYAYEQNVGYGEDKHSKHAEELILKRFGLQDGKVFFLQGGTQANKCVISYLLKPYECVVCCDTGHINVHETGAIEATGHKVLTVQNVNGKLNAAALEKVLQLHSDYHMVKPAMIYISDTTETGTIYSKEELLSLKEVCDKYHLYFYLDGARLGSALTAKTNDVTPEFLSSIADVFYIGGNKNGLAGCEAVVFKDQNLASDFKYHIKNTGAMSAKGFIAGIQFERAFSDNLYFEIGKHENEMADYLYDNLKDVLKFESQVVSNQIFVRMECNKANYLMNKFGCELWTNDGDEKVIRFVTSFLTTKEDCDELIKEIKEKSK